MIYLLIGISIYAMTTTIFLLFFAGSRRNEEKELESLFRDYDCEAVKLSKIDAEIAYLETQYGVDDYMKGNRENNKS